MKPEGIYCAKDLLNALREAGIAGGDVVFVHTCFDQLGSLQDTTTEEHQNRILFEVLREAVGARGTIAIPTYTFSFCRGELFDVASTPTKGGPWSTSAGFLEYFRTQEHVKRSRDPIHSVCALGPEATYLVENVPNTCFGRDSVHDRLHQIGGKVCMIGVGLEESTFQHHVEEMVGVPFRFKKLFTGKIRQDGISMQTGWIFNVHLLAEAGTPDGRRVNQLAQATRIASTARVGADKVTVVHTDSFYRAIAKALTDDPWFTAGGPPCNPIQIENERTRAREFPVDLPPNASMEEMIDALWRLPRDIVSDGYDSALRALAEQIAMTIHEYPSGTECSTWIVPEKWTCHEAWLETLDGHRLFSYSDHPLHVVSYSLPFEGEVSREELLKHLHVHPRLPDAIPFVFKYYERDWGLCCSRRLRESLTDDHYRVHIRSDFSYGTLKVGEVTVKGKSDKTVVLCAHLCHPHMANDDLSGVVTGIEVMRRLLGQQDLRYTYRFLILPETIGSIAYLVHHSELIPQMVGGLFLEMLGAANPATLQLSLAGNTEIDRCFAAVLKENEPYGKVGRYREVIGNDERQFNSPGFRVPMLSLSRVLPSDSPNWPYPECHSSDDTPEIISIRHLESACELVLKMIEAFEANVTPQNQFQGELFCSRFGIRIDGYANPEGDRALFRILDLIDGTRSICDIAEQCRSSFSAVKGVVDELVRHHVVTISKDEEGRAHKFGALGGALPALVAATPNAR
jgi:aminopeptidase-like protein/aminoglycoside N3'-acetyltransferase